MINPWIMLGYFGVGFFLDLFLSQQTEEEWQKKSSGVPLKWSRVITMFLWPLVLTLGILGWILIFIRSKL